MMNRSLLAPRCSLLATLALVLSFVPSHAAAAPKTLITEFTYRDTVFVRGVAGPSNFEMRWHLDAYNEANLLIGSASWDMVPSAADAGATFLADAATVANFRELLLTADRNGWGAVFVSTQLGTFTFPIAGGVENTLLDSGSLHVQVTVHQGLHELPLTSLTRTIDEFIDGPASLLGNTGWEFGGQQTIRLWSEVPEPSGCSLLVVCVALGGGTAHRVGRSRRRPG